MADRCGCRRLSHAEHTWCPCNIAFRWSNSMGMLQYIAHQSPAPLQYIQLWSGTDPDFWNNGICWCSSKHVCKYAVVFTAQYTTYVLAHFPSHKLVAWWEVYFLRGNSELVESDILWLANSFYQASFTAMLWREQRRHRSFFSNISKMVKLKTGAIKILCLT